jgi:ankyrin repeat protein
MTDRSAFVAILTGSLDALTAALDAGTDPNACDGYGNTLLMKAVHWDRLHMVDVLLSRGANVHQKSHDGRTALHVAALRGRRSDLFPAIFSAAGPRAMNFPNCYGWTPLHWLACCGSAEQMAFALSASTSPLTKEKCHFIISKQHFKCTATVMLQIQETHFQETPKDGVYDFECNFLWTAGTKRTVCFLLMGG